MGSVSANKIYPGARLKINRNRSLLHELVAQNFHIAPFRQHGAPRRPSVFIQRLQYDYIKPRRPGQEG